MSYTFRQGNVGLRQLVRPNDLTAPRLTARTHSGPLMVVETDQFDPRSGFPAEDELPPPLLAVVDARWQVVAANRNWMETADRNAFGPRLEIGRSYKSFCEWRRMAGSENAVAVLDGIRDIDGGRRTSFSHASPDDSLQLSIISFSIGGERYATICCTESPRLDAERGEIVLQAEENERQRLARELHDGAAQYLTGLDLAVARLREVTADPAVKAVAEEISSIVDLFHRDLKALTYLRHPPEIGRFGLHAALRLLCTGFAKRTRIHLTLNLLGSDATRDPPVDSAVYRIVQEALSNVYRHARAQHVHVRMTDGAGAVFVVIKDDGIGLRSEENGVPASCGLGVGIAGMMARVREFGGRLVVRNRRKGGTILSAMIPRRLAEPNVLPNAIAGFGRAVGRA